MLPFPGREWYIMPLPFFLCGISACSGNRPYNFYFFWEIKIVCSVPRTEHKSHIFLAHPSLINGPYGSYQMHFPRFDCSIYRRRYHSIAYRSAFSSPFGDWLLEFVCILYLGYWLFLNTPICTVCDSNLASVPFFEFKVVPGGRVKQ